MTKAQFLETVFEVIPMVLACWAFVEVTLSRRKDRRRAMVPIYVMGQVACFLLLALQGSWWHTAVVMEALESTGWINGGWTLYNALMMLVLVAVGRRGRAWEE